MSVSRTGRLWSSLTAASQTRYKNQGISASDYNSWNRRTAANRSEVTKLAREAGYKDGLHFTAARAQVKAHAPRGSISPYAPPRALTPREAARRLMRGSHGKQNKANRKRISQLFPQVEEFDSADWDEFMSG